MRSRAFMLIVSSLLVSGIALSGCASNKKAKPSDLSSEANLPSLEKTEKPVINDGIERVDVKDAPPPKKLGFFSKLTNRIDTSSGVANAGPCPGVKILYEASRFVELTGSERFENVGYTGEMQKVNSNCRYVNDSPITVSLSIEMALGKGPMAKGAYKDVKYWVAVTRKDIAPIDKQFFTGRVYFEPNEKTTTLITPDIGVEIPRRDKEVSGSNFEILVGYDLTPDQLKFNTDGKRFKIDAGAN